MTTKIPLRVRLLVAQAVLVVLCVAPAAARANVCLTCGGGGGGSGLIATTTQLGSSANPSTYGTPVTLTATVRAGTSTPSAGSVTFTIDGNSATAQTVAVSGSGATITLPGTALAPGSHTVDAAYSDSTATYAPSNATQLAQVVDTPAGGNLVLNGSFETPVLNFSFGTYGAGTGPSPWTVASGSIDVLGSGWQPATGSQSLDLDGNSRGRIYQDVPTIAGHQYQLRFAMAENACWDIGGTPYVSQMTVSWDGTTVDQPTFDATGQSASNMGWAYHSYTVTATGATTRLQFASDTGGACGPTLDDVSVTDTTPSQGGGGSGGSGGAGGGGGTGGNPGPPTSCSTRIKFGLIEADGCWTQSGSQYISTQSASVNGITISPDGSELVLDSANGHVFVTGSAGGSLWLGGMDIYDGPIDWMIPGNPGLQVAQFDPNPKVTFGTFAVGGHMSLSFVQNGISIETALRLPDVFQGLTGQTTIVSDEDHQFSLGGLQLSADDLKLGPINLVNVNLSFDLSTNTWQGGATIYLPTPYQLGIIGGLSIVNGQFQSATAGVDNLNVPLGAGLFLQRIQLSIAVNPLDIGGGIGISAGPILPVSVTGGPNTAPHPGEAALRIDGNLDWRFSNPWRLHVDGALKVVDASMASAYFDYYSTGTMDFGGKFEIGLPDTSDPDHQPVYIGALLNGWVDGSRAFDAEAQGMVRILGFDVAGAQILVSNIGIAGCGNVTPWLYGGFGYTWVDQSLTLMGNGCDVSPYRPAAPAVMSAADGRIIRFAGARTRILKLVGSGRLPRVLLRGPRGRRLLTPVDGRPLVNGQFVVLQDAKADTTYVAIRHASGAWKLTPERGTVLRDVLVAGVMPKPVVHATVSAHNRTRILRYAIAAPAGTRVQFAEAGSQIHHLLGTATGRRGTLRFVPAVGPAGRREIVAIISQHGMPVAQTVVARFAAPVTPRALAVRGLKASRRGAALLVSWRPDPGSVRGYTVRLDIKDGASRLLFVAPGHHSAVFPAALGPGDSGTITVTGVGVDGRTGAGARVVVRAVGR